MKLYFLAGLPRSGSTLLAAILNQNPKIYTSPTSNLIALMGNAVKSWENDPSSFVQGRNEDEIFNVLKSIAESKYLYNEKPIIIDKSRGWADPTILDTLSKIFKTKPKVIATVRNTADCAASFVRIVKPENVYNFLKYSQPISHLIDSYVTLSKGYESNPEYFCIVDYDNLIKDPKREIERIHEFLELESFDYDFDNIDGSIVKEEDENVWGIKDLHTIQPKIKKQHNQDSIDVLGDSFLDFNQPAFWKGETEKPKTDLDVQLELALEGNFKESRIYLDKFLQDYPNNNRAKFNLGWFKLYEGNLLDGHKYLESGRLENVWGNSIPTQAPIWSGKPETVLLHLEGGLGDQIWGVRYAKKLADRGCKVLISCNRLLAEVFKSVDGVTAIVANEYAGHVYHDSWLPSFSAPLVFNESYSDISNEPYIRSSTKNRNKRLKIGLRWQGNPNFSHEKYRRFPTNQFFESFKDIDADFISLQNDEASALKPEWVQEVNLSNWTETCRNIAECDLIVSSCTSVAHMAAAMGKEVFIIVPILPYFLWAPPGENTVWYKNTKLIRQTEADNWNSAFAKLKEMLQEYS